MTFVTWLTFAFCLLFAGVYLVEIFGRRNPVQQEETKLTKWGPAARCSLRLLLFKNLFPGRLGIEPEDDSGTACLARSAERAVRNGSPVCERRSLNTGVQGIPAA